MMRERKGLPPHRPRKEMTSNLPFSFSENFEQLTIPSSAGLSARYTFMDVRHSLHLITLDQAVPDEVVQDVLDRG